MSIKLSPLNEQQLVALSNLSSELNREQIIWLNGYFQGLLGSPGNALQLPVSSSTNTGKRLTILYGTHTGRSKIIADKLAKKLSILGVDVHEFALDEYKTRQLTTEKNVVFIVSTHGEGEPPAMAEDFHAFITGKRSPKLPNLSFSVVALGDRSYKLFCQTGIDINQALKTAGANEILPILKLDVDYEEEAENWINQFTEVFAETSETSIESSSLVGSTDEAIQYSRKKPFVGTVIDKVKITGRDSDKEVYHVEISLEGSGIKYEPGDSVGILANNPPTLVEAILKQTKLGGNDLVLIKDGEFSLVEALSDHLEITVLTRDVIQKYQQLSGDKELLEIIEDEAKLDGLLYGHDLIDLLEEFPYEFNSQELAEVLRSFPARLYSISSSQDAVGDEVHVTVSAVSAEPRVMRRSRPPTALTSTRCTVSGTPAGSPGPGLGRARSVHRGVRNGGAFGSSRTRRSGCVVRARRNYDGCVLVDNTPHSCCLANPAKMTAATSAHRLATRPP
jgi:sulfite reductase (NADPH) flavoprotein alpha-component